MLEISVLAEDIDWCTVWNSLQISIGYVVMCKSVTSYVTVSEGGVYKEDKNRWVELLQTIPYVLQLEYGIAKMCVSFLLFRNRFRWQVPWHCKEVFNLFNAFLYQFFTKEDTNFISSQQEQLLRQRQSLRWTAREPSFALVGKGCAWCSKDKVFSNRSSTW